MTYLELANKILNQFTKEQQEMNVTIYDKFDDEWFGINKLDIIIEDDVLDKSHPFLILEREV